MNARAFCAWCSGCLLVLVGGSTAVGQAPQEQNRKVAVAQPLVRQVTDYQVYTGRTTASVNVDLHARVTGFLERVYFKEGEFVKKGEVLFAIDPRVYQAVLAQAEAKFALSQAELLRAQADYTRAQALFPKGSISKEEFETAAAKKATAQAAVGVAKAARDLSQFQLDNTKVLAPVAGQIGRRLLDPGNLVKADESLLAKIIVADPMYVYFDIDELTAVLLAKAMRAGKAKEGLWVEIGLAGDKGYPRKGKVDFFDSAVNPQTGTLRVRAILAKADGLLPGMFTRVHLTIGEPHKALLVPSPALAKRKGGSWVLVVNDKNVLELRKVTLGPDYDGLRVVKDGLQPGDWVVLDQREVAPGMTVVPEKKKLP